MFRRFVYFVVMIMTGGSAGVGGWFFKDYPQLKALTEAVLGESVDDIAQTKSARIKAKVTTAVSEVLSRDSKGPGVYKVRITTLELDPRQFAQGKTVDLQAEVRKIDVRGNSTVVWESKAFGENLAVVGRDDLVVDWNNRPFEIEWRPGEQIVVSAWDRKSGFFNPKAFKMALPEPDSFPLASGPHTLAASGKNAPQSTLNRIVFDSRRAAGSSSTIDAPSSDQDASERSVARRPGASRRTSDASDSPIIIR